jgi:hypothetical protein
VSQPCVHFALCELQVYIIMYPAAGSITDITATTKPTRYSYFHLLSGRARKMHQVTSASIELGSSYTDYADKVKTH